MRHRDFRTLLIVLGECGKPANEILVFRKSTRYSDHSAGSLDHELVSLQTIYATEFFGLIAEFVNSRPRLCSCLTRSKSR